MNEKDIIKLFKSTNTMKYLPRSGWLLRGIKNCESVSDHSYQVVFISLILGYYLKDKHDIKINMEKLLSIAALHDIGESLITDIPEPALRFSGSKSNFEENAINELFDNFEFKDKFIALWKEFEYRESNEGIIVKIADKIDMLIQAYQYNLHGFKNLKEFWDFGKSNPDFKFEWIEDLISELLNLENEVENQV